MTTRVGRAIVRQYPAAWRERYEDEVLALLDDSKPRASDVFELSRGLIVERAKSVIEPADHPTLTDVVFRGMASLINIAPAVTLVVGGAALGGKLAVWLGRPPDVVSMIAVACCVLVVLIDVGARRIFGVELRRAFNLGLVFATVLFIVTWHWVGTASESVSTRLHWAQLFIWTAVAHRLLATRFPWRPMFDAVERYQAASEAVRRAQADVDRCRASSERAAQWHLQPALDTLAQYEQQRDEARAIIDGYGYRSRFQRGGGGRP